jgi:hypothetical protein
MQVNLAIGLPSTLNFASITTLIQILPGQSETVFYASLIFRQHRLHKR